MAISSIAGVSNVTLWNLARKADPTFASHTSEGTKEMFSERGFEALTRNGLDVITSVCKVSISDSSVINLDSTFVSLVSNPDISCVFV